jgi:hypothetical protein
MLLARAIVAGVGEVALAAGVSFLCIPALILVMKLVALLPLLSPF